MTQKGQFTWENYPNKETGAFIRSYISFVEDLEGVGCVTFEWDRDDKILFVISWANEDLVENREEEVYNAEYETSKGFGPKTFALEFSLRKEVPGLPDCIRRWAGLTAIWFKNQIVCSNPEQK